MIKKLLRVILLLLLLLILAACDVRSYPALSKQDELQADAIRFVAYCQAASCDEVGVEASVGNSNQQSSIEQAFQLLTQVSEEDVRAMRAYQYLDGTIPAPQHGIKDGYWLAASDTSSAIAENAPRIMFFFDSDGVFQYADGGLADSEGAYCLLSYPEK